jgi:hypothetical protein
MTGVAVMVSALSEGGGGWHVVIKHHTPGNNPKDYAQHLKHGKSLKSRNIFILLPSVQI